MCHEPRGATCLPPHPPTLLLRRRNHLHFRNLKEAAALRKQLAATLAQQGGTAPPALREFLGGAALGALGPQGGERRGGKGGGAHGGAGALPPLTALLMEALRKALAAGAHIVLPAVVFLPCCRPPGAKQGTALRMSPDCASAGQGRKRGLGPPVMCLGGKMAEHLYLIKSSQTGHPAWLCRRMGGPGGAAGEGARVPPIPIGAGEVERSACQCVHRTQQAGQCPPAVPLSLEV